MKISPAQSDFLNWSRWVAAWLVVAEHARSLIFVDYGELQSPGILAKGFYFLTGFGHEAVMVFFVISGYLVGGKVWSLYREGRFGWRRYLADRASRLYAVLFVALLLGAAMDWTGYLFFNKYGLYNQGYEGSIAVLGAAPIERMGWRDFLVNAFFLQTIVGPTFGSNGPLWSLAYEWWYYVLFPLALAAVWPMVDGGWRRAEGKAEKLKAETLKTLDAGRSTLDASSPATSYPLPATLALRALGSLLAVAGLCWFLTWEILIFFGVWLLGVAAAVVGKAESGNAEKLKKEQTTDDSNGHNQAPGQVCGRLPQGSPEGETSGNERVKYGPAGGNQHADSAEFLEGHSQAGLQMDSEKLTSIRAANAPCDSGANSSSVSISAISGKKKSTAPAALALDSGRWSLASSALSALFFGAVLLLARAEVLKVPYGWQYLLGVAFALVLLSLAKGSRRWVWSKPSAYLADFSYSVYLIHFPVLMLVISVAFSLTGYGIKVPFGTLGLIWFAVVFVLAILFAWMVSLVTEARTAQLREVLYRIFRIEPRITPINTK